MQLQSLAVFAVVWLVSWQIDVPRFNIHGLWPAREYCDNASTLNTTALEPLMPWLHQFWSTNTTFLEHEWQKHGTCYGDADSADADALQAHAQYGYFDKALKLYFAIDPTPRLLDANVLPSDTVNYSLCDIEKAVSAQLPHTVVATPICIGNELSQIQYATAQATGCTNCPDYDIAFKAA